MMELNGKWFYKAPEAKTIDIDAPHSLRSLCEGAADLTLKIFAPPASGENDPSQGADWPDGLPTPLSPSCTKTFVSRFAPIIEG